MTSGRMRTLLKLTWLETKLFIRDPLSMIFTFGLPIIFLVVLAGVFGNVPDPTVYRGVGPIDYYVPAYVALVIAAISVMNLPIRLTGYREHGVLRRFRASGIPLWQVLGAQLLVMLFIAALGALLVMVIALLVYDAGLPEYPGLVVLAFVASVMGFGAFGIFLGSVLPTTRAALGLGLVLFFVMMIVGGAGPPPEVLSDAMRGIGIATPMWHVIVVLQEPWLGFGWDWAEFGVVAGIGLVSAALSLRFFRWE